MHKKKSRRYNEFFSTFSFNSFLDLLSLKREAYSFEKELRLFITPKTNFIRNRYKNAMAKDVSIDWSKVIKGARIDKNCLASELTAIQRACLSIGINPVIKNFKFLGNLPAKYKNCKTIEFERFNIDEMPGKGKITIL